MTTLISAHRGGNDRTRLDAALASDADAIEFDVQATADGAFVVAHDPDLAGVPIEHLTLDAAKVARPSLLTMRDVLGTIKEAGAFAHVDFKFDGAEIAAMSEIDAVLDREQYVITTMVDHSLRVIRDECGPDVMCGLSLGSPSVSRIERWKDRHLAARRLDACGADVVVAYYGAATEHLADLAASTGRRLLIWTPDLDVEIERWLGDDRCWMLTTNRPDRAVELRG